MASSATRISLPTCTNAVSTATAVRRHVTPEAGRALEKLGHAIEYLTDEMVQRGESMESNAGDLAAVKILMGLNRSIYNDCPPATGLADRWQALLRRFTL